MICQLPQTLEFLPAMDGGEKEPVILTVDEYETIRLIDREGLSQEQCSRRMQVARTTAQKIYDTARKKLASAGIRLYGGVTGDADAAVESLLAGPLAYVPNVQYGHHEGATTGETGFTGSQRGCGLNYNIRHTTAFAASGGCPAPGAAPPEKGR
ncbi:MAG: DUF134 domain-containing protein [Clostridiales bacterium]|nr:DUF134 domain-containing protein [Clostridiales bacterium]